MIAISRPLLVLLLVVAAGSCDTSGARRPDSFKRSLGSGTLDLSRLTSAGDSTMSGS